MPRKLTKRAAPPAVYGALQDRCEAAERLVAEQRATIARLQQAVHAAQRRAELAEASARELASRAYAGFAAAGARR